MPLHVQRNHDLTTGHRGPQQAVHPVLGCALQQFVGILDGLWQRAPRSEFDQSRVRSGHQKVPNVPRPTASARCTVSVAPDRAVTGAVFAVRMTSRANGPGGRKTIETDSTINIRIVSCVRRRTECPVPMCSPVDATT